TPKKPIKIGDSVSVKELSEKMGKPVTDIIKKLLLLGVIANINQVLDFDTALIICEEFGISVEKLIDRGSEEVLLKTEEDKPEDLLPRPPVVTIMGHVDHGKTSLLDAIRQANVIATEAGGITQHIGAYTVNIGGKKIAFLDTPGHEAFTAMRARGAKVTDIAILVVAADDGVMPQTVEAINHAKAANVAIIVAINKIDKPGANPDRVKQELTEYGLLAEDWGGDAVMVPVSAKKKEGISTLLEMILLVAEIQELKANPNKNGIGTVIEAELDKGKGPVATVLIQDGSLNLGDYFIVGNTHGKVRGMIDDKGKRLKKAGPSTPVEIQGLDEVPDAGDIFIVVDDEKVAKTISEKRKDKQRLTQVQSKQTVSLEELFNQIQEGKVKDLNIIVKADVQGSVEAVKQSLARLSNDEVKVNTIHGGVGAITESDVMLASASNAIIIGFNVRPQPMAITLAEKDKVDIRLYRVIYNAIEDVEAAMKGMLEPEYKEVVLGHAEVRATFKASAVGTIAGCYVTDGKINRNNEIRIIRDSIVIHEGTLASLKRFKDDAKEVNTGYECGLNVEKFNDIKEGDIIESFTMEAVPRK
ncbi:MAG: translation initiation factor IF-2, partial [Clostridiaceae bacterium]|nr:translation initiation factor IF-2 [Clostridiaceae bacterium]